MFISHKEFTNQQRKDIYGAIIKLIRVQCCLNGHTVDYFSEVVSNALIKLPTKVQSLDLVSMFQETMEF